ncbi:glycosyltransferase family 4 protein [Microbulbifer yueqingensis]|uniref:Phosphatidylinositol alpha-1,6-mannosyltransferase n=1 Tax=Microbulbifer yueqingensis TaxID=658219 RepID=A0A1G8YBJ5_9GAMM|nr:glycosyltransferase family 4 protein [Microbulbifer yueqingensis]SDK00066.1 phosphatidylinositol alpha-1,6-mannosyltransferase [Microbulbifer yueqingensis]
MILITTQCFPPRRGGIEMLMEGLAENLVEAGYRVRVLADRVGEEEGPHGKGYELSLYGGWKLWRRRRKARAVRAAVRRGDVEAVFADSWKSAELLSGLGVPLVVLAHGMEFPANPDRAKRARISRTFAAATTVVANSSYTAELARPYIGEGTRLVVINPPIGPQPEPQPARVAALEQVIGDRGPVLLTLARLEPRKGVDAVIRALPEIRQRHPKVLYIVAGKGDDRARLEQLASASGVADSVHFAGAVSEQEKAALFSRADLFVMPARREGDSVEGFGIVYREANWYGVPALAGREGGAADAVSDGETGLLCDAGQQADVTAHILSLLDEPARLREMGANAERLARGRGQWRASIERFLEAVN